MTPLVTFLLGTVLLTGVTTGADQDQGAADSLRLPACAEAAPVDPGAECFPVTVDAKGQWWVDGEAVDRAGFRAAFAAWRERVRPADENGFCAHPLRIRADQRAAAKHLQQLMQIAGQVDFKVYRIQILTAGRTEDGKPRALPYYLPKDVGVRAAEPVEHVELHLLRTVQPRGDDWRFDTAELEVRLGPVKVADLAQAQKPLEQARAAIPNGEVILHPRSGTLCADLVALLGLCHRAGVRFPLLAGVPAEG